MKERFQAMKNLPEFFKLIWQTSPKLLSVNILLRVIRAAIPLTTLYVGKLIIDEIIRITQTQDTTNLQYLFILVGIEFALAIFSDMLNRGTTLLDSLIGDLFANKSSIRLMQHASTMDLNQFEDAEFYDKLERARRQTITRSMLMTQVLGQVQDLITMLFLAAGLVVFNPWLILLLVVAVIPAFLGETHFNERSYSLVYSWTPERRELDYLRYTGASDETAKEVKIFSLSDFLTNRFKYLSDKFYEMNKKLSIKRAGWGSLFAILGSAGYYAAYIFIIYDTINGRISIGDLTFLSGSFFRLRALFESILNRFSSVAENALYLGDFFDFFHLEPTIKTNAKALPFPSPIRDGFVFENVGFRYRNSEIWAVKNLSFKLKKGEKLALVGENGA